MKIIGTIILALIMASGTVWAGPKETAGTLSGVIVGNEFGRSLDRADQAVMYANYQTTLETSRSNHSTTWVNPDTGSSGSLTPTNTYQNRSGQYCREYQTIVTIDDRRQQAYGTACRQTDGYWQIAAAEQPVQVRQVTSVRYVEPRYVAYRYRDPYRYGYYPPVRGYFSIGYSKYGHGRKHYSGHRYRGGQHKNLYKHKYRGKGSGHGYFRGVKHHRGRH